MPCCIPFASSGPCTVQALQYLQGADIMDHPFFFVLCSVLHCRAAFSASLTEFISRLSYSPCLNVPVYLRACDVAPTVAGKVYMNTAVQFTLVQV